MHTKKKIPNIKEAIYETIVFFDIFDYPLTAFEIWNFLGLDCDLNQVMEGLEDSKAIEKKQAFYFLPGREGVIETRARRYNYFDRKMKRAVWISKIFRLVPWIKMIAIGNMMGGHNLKNNSDIDFFIISERKKIWLSRFVVTLITKFLFLRPRVNDVKDKICLSFYVSEDNLNLENLHLDRNKDRYFVYWLANLVPIYSMGNIYDEFIQQNKWIYSYLPNWEKKLVSTHRDISFRDKHFYKNILDMFLGGLETSMKKLQMKILPNDIKSLMNKDSRVVISDKVLKFHVNDRRIIYRDMYEKKFEKIKNEKDH